MDRTKQILIYVSVFIAIAGAVASVFWLKPSQSGEIVVPAIGTRR